jgi:hypothetical protein
MVGRLEGRELLAVAHYTCLHREAASCHLFRSIVPTIDPGSPSLDGGSPTSMTES